VKKQLELKKQIGFIEIPGVALIVQKHSQTLFKVAVVRGNGTNRSLRTAAAKLLKCRESCVLDNALGVQKLVARLKAGT
jgi:hypothetical protein